jgi:hypothetical protein
VAFVKPSAEMLRWHDPGLYYILRGRRLEELCTEGQSIGHKRIIQLNSMRCREGSTPRLKIVQGLWQKSLPPELTAESWELYGKYRGCPG